MLLQYNVLVWWVRWDEKLEEQNGCQIRITTSYSYVLRQNLSLHTVTADF